MPNGIDGKREAQLHSASHLLQRDIRIALQDWWLAVAPSGTPNWDIASTCKIGDKKGLLLIESHAYEGEMHRSPKRESTSDRGYKNQQQIIKAIAEANEGLKVCMGLQNWALSGESHYLFSDRFAWAWKVASLGVPVVLVNLCFLNATEMDGAGRRIFTSPEQWSECVHKHAKGIVPRQVWNQQIKVNDTPLVTLIRSEQIDLPFHE